MSGRRHRSGGSARRAPIAAFVLLAGLGGCAASPPKAAGPDPAPAAALTHEAMDSSWDWHGLLAAPFGSSLKDVPFRLHEVLLFNEAQSAASADDAECYAADAAAPRFIGRTAEEYLLCFKRDHLARIEAAVRLEAAAAEPLFADACVQWLKNASPETLAAPAFTPGQGACEGNDGGVRFRGRLAHESPPGDAADGARTLLSITLEPSPDRQ